MSVNIPVPPKITIILRPDGTIEDVAVFARDPDARTIGMRLIGLLSREINAFEDAAVARLARTPEVADA